MTNNPLVSLVIPTRNRRDLLKEAVSSVFGQTLDAWELIVVDDVSEDGTWTWLGGLSDPRVRPIRLDQHSERAKARNRGLETATAPFVLFLDDDDILPAQALEKHVDALRKHPAAIASVGGYRPFDEHGARRTIRLVRRTKLRSIWYDLLFASPPVSGQCVFRIESVRAVNGWNDAYNFAEDHELWLRVGGLGPVALLPDIVLRYRVHSGQWRPRTSEQIMTEVRERAIASIPGPDRLIAEGILQARALVRIVNEGTRADVVKALRANPRALGVIPRFLASPLTRPKVLRAIVTFLLGRRGTSLARRILSGVRAFFRREIRGSVQIVESSGSAPRTGTERP